MFTRTTYRTSVYGFKKVKSVDWEKVFGLLAAVVVVSGIAFIASAMAYTNVLLASLINN